MLTIGDKLPAFRVKAVVSSDPNDAFTEISHESFPGQWRVLFFWPKDFTFVCPTELRGFGELTGAFRERNAQLLGASVDSEYVHLAWRQSQPDLAKLPYPMLSDITRELSQALGILDAKEGVANRATFIIDPEQTIRYASVTDLKVGRNPSEVLRVLDALQTDALTPCAWRPGEATL